MRDILARDGRRLALIAALLAAGGACGGSDGAGRDDAGGIAAIDAPAGDGGDDGGDDPGEDAGAVDLPPPAVCPAAAGETTNASCNDVVATGPCVSPVMVDDNAPGPEGGTLVAGTYDLSARIVYTNPGGATGPAGEPLAETIVLSGAGTTWTIEVADLSAASASRRTLSLTLVGSNGQTRATATCPVPEPANANAGPLYYTAADGTLVIYHLGANGPIQADTYTAR